MPITGSLVPNITLFDRDGRIDPQRTAWHMRWMFEHGVDGLFLTGSYGAGPLLSAEERVGVYRLAREVASGFRGRTLIAHVGCIDAAGAVALARAAEEVGMDAVAAVPPFYYKHGDEAVIAYYASILRATRLPVFAYNNPETTRYTFNLKTVRRLQALGLAGLKDSPLSLGFVTQVVYEAQEAGSAFQFIPGTSTGWLPLCHMGLEAVIAGTNNWAPEIMTELLRATRAGDLARARKVYLVMMDLSARMHFADSTVASHMALYARGFDGAFPREPMILPPLEEPRYAEIRGWLAQGFEALGLPLQTGPLR